MVFLSETNSENFLSIPSSSFMIYLFSFYVILIAQIFSRNFSSSQDTIVNKIWATSPSKETCYKKQNFRGCEYCNQALQEVWKVITFLSMTSIP